LKNGFCVPAFLLEQSDDTQAHEAVDEMAGPFESGAGGSAELFEKKHSVVSDLKGRGADGVKSASDAKG
jgi:hypothetical protein